MLNRRNSRFAPIGEIADYCLVSRVTVRLWIIDGKLPAMTLPSGHHRVKVEDFKRFLEVFNMPVYTEFLKNMEEPITRIPPHRSGHQVLLTDRVRVKKAGRLLYVTHTRSDDNKGNVLSSVKSRR
jgi:excisionase family DNA binding protein